MTRTRIHRLAGWLHRRAENILALMIGVMFAAFLFQIVARYLLNFPVGWTSELSAILWIWLVLFGAAFVTRENEEIRFDLLYAMAGQRMRKAMFVVGAVMLLILYIMSFPAIWSYVTFMKVEKTAYLNIPFNRVYSIYLAFALAIIARYLFLLWQAFFRGPPKELEPDPNTEPKT
ncbi:MAG TPA: TRAP transporter small permease subunit [Rhizobiaceae bacterium]|nr:TRAP transporter small permease subunit [Rhizobiaceae bacterium]